MITTLLEAANTKKISNTLELKKLASSLEYQHIVITLLKIKHLLVWLLRVFLPPFNLIRYLG
jgi:hypothetical protein